MVYKIGDIYIMDIATTVLGGLTVAMIAGIIGRFVGSNGKISDDHCEEKRTACRALLIEKIDNIDGKVDDLKTLIKGGKVG